MKARNQGWALTYWLVSLAWGMVAPEAGFAQPSATNGVPGTPDFQVVKIVGGVKILKRGTAEPVETNMDTTLYEGDTIITGQNDQAVLKISGIDGRQLRLGPNNRIRILTAAERKSNFGFRFYRALLYYFHRDNPGDFEFETEWVSAVVKGTEFNVSAEEDGTMTVTVFEGEVELRTAQGVRSFQATQASGPVQGVAGPGKTPELRPVIHARNIIQWSLYYPGVLHLDDLELAAEEQGLLAGSLAAYRRGNLPQALAQYPAGRQPAANADKLFRAALLLSAGQVDECLGLLDLIGDGTASPRDSLNSRLAEALRQVIAAVKMESFAGTRRPVDPDEWLATEWLAESYYRQSQSGNKVALTLALEAAANAVQRSPNFSFAWARRAELEFSFPNNHKALSAVEKSLDLAPENAEALALKGFLLSAENKIAAAIDYFDQAISVDGALGNAWLGRGLCRIRQGRLREGREDLATAALLEPQRAFLRSYLGKAYSDEGEREKADRALARAKDLDPKDPTAWLYSALHDQQYNRLNEAVRELEEAQKKNENRSLYRSKFALDQDRAVRSANLAAIYRDLGMTDVSVREAVRAVSADYANYSAHLFLANSYDQLRDPKLINLRYETPANNEYLIANLLAPVGAGTLSPTLSQQEYSKLFERDHFGLASTTEYLSSGSWMESASQYGTFKNSSYALEAFYRSENGQRPNNDLEQRQFSLQLKQQFTPQDTVFLQAIQTDLRSGDLAQYYDQSSANLAFRSKETQEPILSLGYHREWSPGVHTLFLASHLDDTLSLAFDPPGAPTFFVTKFTSPAPTVAAVRGFSVQEDFRGRLDIYSTELQQIWQSEKHQTIIGARLQYGDFDTKSVQDHPSDYGVFFDSSGPIGLQDFSLIFRRVSGYGYHDWQLFDSLRLTGGLSYDWITFPENFRTTPISAGEQSVARLLPKAGAIWTPSSKTTLRAAYTRSLAGASLDQSFQLEPSQVGGFLQSYRSIIPESVAGANAGASFETFHASLEQKLGSGTYFGLSGEILNSSIRRTVGAFDVYIPQQFDFPIESGLREHLDYRERSLLFTLNQLVGTEWSFGVRYRLSQAQLNDDFVEVPDDARLLVQFRPRQKLESVLHQLNLFAIFNHPSGLFAQAQANWNLQSNSGYQLGTPDDSNYWPDRPGTEFWQVDAFVGYRLKQRRAEFTLGVLNIAGHDYRLNPLTLFNELPRERTLLARFRFHF